jgi:hypothetical protein
MTHRSFAVPIVEESTITGIASLALGLDLTADQFAALAVGAARIHGITLNGSDFVCVTYSDSIRLTGDQKVLALPRQHTAIIVVERETFRQFQERLGVDPSPLFVLAVKPLLDEWRNGGALPASPKPLAERLLEILEIKIGIPGIHVDLSKAINEIIKWLRTKQDRTTA